MLKRYWLSAVIAVALLMSASCSTLNVGNSSPERESAEAFSLNVLEDSYFNGSSVEGYYLTTEETDTHTMVSINAYGAADLKALYFEMDYDAERYRPMTVVNTDALAETGDRLSLTHLGDRGTVISGQMVANPDWHAGFSGEGVLATVNFRKQATPALREAAAANIKPAAEPIDVAWDGVDTLTWLYNHPGDYNQDSLVTIADLTPLGQNFLEGDGTGFSSSSVESVVDGDSNGIINLADITTIGQNFQLSANGGYNVYAGDGSTDYPDGPGSDDKIAALENVAFATGVGPAGTNRLAFTYTVAAPTAGDEYWVRAVGNAATELGTPSVPVGGDPNDNPTIELDGPTPGTGDGLGTTSPYILGNADVASTYTFSVYDSVNNGSAERTGSAGCTIVAEPAGAVTNIDQATGEVDFDGSFTDTTFSISATVDGDNTNRIYFRIELAAVGLYIFPDPADNDWASVTGDGLTEPTAYIVGTDSFNTDGSVEFSFVANDAVDNTGNAIDVNTLTWDAGFPFMVTNGWATPGTATFFTDIGTNTYVFAQDGDLNNSNDIYVATENLPE